MSMDRRTFLVGTAGLMLASCAPRQRMVSIGTKNFTEQLILGELIAQTLEHRITTPVERRFYLAGTYICQQAILSRRIDAYVEYTGTALAAILKRSAPTDPAEVFNIVRDEYQRRFQLTVLPSLGFNNSFALAMRGDDARAKGITKLSQLAQHAPSMRLGVGYEFLERPDGFPGLARTYGLNFSAPPSVMDLGLLYRALESRQADIVAGSNTDGLIGALGLVVLEDDRNHFPPYDAVPIVRTRSLQEIPGLQSALSQLCGTITTEDMRKMNYAVDGQKQDAADVARNFLASHSNKEGRLGERPSSKYRSATSLLARRQALDPFTSLF
jgi:osmoprotectant transport system substrate-binding protein